MTTIGKGIRITAGAALLAAALGAILAIPGFVAERAGTVPVHARREVPR
jgi:hypothetical protein